MICSLAVEVANSKRRNSVEIKIFNASQAKDWPKKICLKFCYDQLTVRVMLNLNLTKKIPIQLRGPALNGMKA